MIETAIVELISCAGYRFPPEVISHAVWLCSRLPLRLRMVRETF
jgi:putative transposase